MFRTKRFRPARPFGMLGRVMILAVGIVGCGTEQKSAVPLFPVQGTVTVDGKPLAGGTVEFIPAGDTRGQGGTGQTKPDGTYHLATPFGESGIAAGEYQVVIQTAEVPEGFGTEDPASPTSPTGGSASKAPPLPPIYSDRARTTLTATVTPDGNAPHDFALKSARKGP
jgi:hypothetical protein